MEVCYCPTGEVIWPRSRVARATQPQRPTALTPCSVAAPRRRFCAPCRVSQRLEAKDETMNYGLIKSEPDAWSWDDQVKKGAKGEAWTGVRNHAAKLNLMK